MSKMIKNKNPAKNTRLDALVDKVGDLAIDKHYSSTLKDARNKKFRLGDKVCRALKMGSSAGLEICTVTRLESNKMWLNNNNLPILYPQRLLIITALVEAEDALKDREAAAGSSAEAVPSEST